MVIVSPCTPQIITDSKNHKIGDRFNSFWTLFHRISVNDMNYHKLSQISIHTSFSVDFLLFPSISALKSTAIQFTIWLGYFALFLLFYFFIFYLFLFILIYVNFIFIHFSIKSNRCLRSFQISFLSYISIAENLLFPIYGFWFFYCTR